MTKAKYIPFQSIDHFILEEKLMLFQYLGHILHKHNINRIQIHKFLFDSITHIYVTAISLLLSHFVMQYNFITTMLVHAQMVFI